MATNPTVEGDGTALYISNLLADVPIRNHSLGAGSPAAACWNSPTRKSSRTLSPGVRPSERTTFIGDSHAIIVRS